MRGKKKRVNYWRARETVGDAAGGFRVTETGYHFLTEAGLVSPSGQTKRSLRDGKERIQKRERAKRTSRDKSHGRSGTDRR